MSLSEPVSNARDVEITLGRLCPYCGETRQIEPIRVGWLCGCCARMWNALPQSYQR